jgi:nitrogen fixation NifU-like protein
MIGSGLQTDDVRDLYRELILDHARNPRHFGKLDHTTHSAEGINPLCGDKLKLYLDVGSDETIRDAAFEGSGCAISVASASLLTDAVIGLSSDDAMVFFDTVTAQLSGSDVVSRGMRSSQHCGRTRRLRVRSRTSDVRTHE